MSLRGQVLGLIVFTVLAAVVAVFLPGFIVLAAVLFTAAIYAAKK